MGWDCFATRNGGRELDDGDLAAFKDAAAKVLTRWDSVDGLLSGGGLNLSGCADAIERLSTLNAWASDAASAETVRRDVRHVELVGDDFYDDNAAAFLAVCVDRGLGIFWSY